MHFWNLIKIQRSLLNSESSLRWICAGASCRGHNPQLTCNSHHRIVITGTGSKREHQAAPRRLNTRHMLKRAPRSLNTRQNYPVKIALKQNSTKAPGWARQSCGNGRRGWCTSRLLQSQSAYAYDVTVVTVAVSKYLELTNDIYANFMKHINKKQM